jgi:hypothetical protein
MLAAPNNKLILENRKAALRIIIKDKNKIPITFLVQTNSFRKGCFDLKNPFLKSKFQNRLSS